MIVHFKDGRRIFAGIERFGDCYCSECLHLIPKKAYRIRVSSFKYRCLRCLRFEWLEEAYNNKPNIVRGEVYEDTEIDIPVWKYSS